MSTLRLLAAVSAIAALAACDRSPVEPAVLRPNSVAFRRGADDPKPRQEPQPGDDRGGTTTTGTTTTTTTSGAPQPGDDRGGKGHGADDPANHG